MAVAEEERIRAKKRAAREFPASPVGRARAAFERGDKLFQYHLDVKETTAAVVPMVGAKTSTQTTDPSAVLNAVCAEGWDLVNGCFVFHELGSESRDKFLASGQNVAVKGTVVGYYLFKRSEDNRSTE